jgi:nucleotide-binding universal stress UspA family protein
MPEKVLLATDGSKDAALAARAAVDVCEGTGAELHVVHAWHSVPTARGTHTEFPNSSSTHSAE